MEHPVLRLINEATTSKDNNSGISPVPTTVNVSETTSSGSNANENAPSGFQQSTTPSGSSGSSTLAFENVHIQLAGSSTYGGIQPFDAPLTSHAGVMRIFLLQVKVLNHSLTLAQILI